jgi:DNA replication protein DnaC
MSTDLDPLFKRLHLANARRVWRDLVRRAELEEWSYEQLLTTLISEEVAHRRGTRLHRAVRSAQFPFLRTIEEFDFSYQSTLRLTTFGSLLSPDFITEGHSVILEGKPGRGKTHLAIAIAYRAMQNGFEALFVNCAELIDDLSCASRRGELRDALMRYLRPHVLVVDEVGYLAYGDDAANVLFHVVNERHIKKRAMVFTTNKKPKRWGPVLHDDDLAEAIVDRILDRGRLLRLDGPSLRTKHLAGDTSLDDDQDEPGDRRVSGTNTAEFPEPTPAAALLDGHDGGAVGQRADWLTPRRGLGSNVRVAVRIIDDERAHLPWSGGSDREKSVDRLAQRDRDHRVTVRETALLQLGRRAGVICSRSSPKCSRCVPSRSKAQAR